MLTIFILLTCFIIIICFTRPNSVINNKYIANSMICLLFIYASILLMVSENNSIDMFIYLEEYYVFKHYSVSETLQLSSREPLFVLFQWVTSQFSTSPQFFYISVWFLFSIPLLISLRKIFKPWQLLVSFFCYLNYFIFFNYVTNTIRQGFAITFLIVAICSLVSEKRKNGLFYIPVISAPLFHITALPLSVTLWLVKVFKFKTKTLIFFWLAFAFLFVTKLNTIIFGKLSKVIPDIDAYTITSVMDRYAGGTNRLDFLIFSAMWILFALIAKKKLLKNDATYETLIKIYISFNIYFLALGFIGFSDRIASYSWFMVPILVLYPFLKDEKPKPLTLVLIVITFAAVSVIRGSILYDQPLFY